MFKLRKAKKSSSDVNSLAHRKWLNDQAYLDSLHNKKNLSWGDLAQVERPYCPQPAVAQEPVEEAPQPVVQEPVVQDADTAYLNRAYLADHQAVALQNELADFYSNGVDWRYDPSADTVNRYRNY